MSLRRLVLALAATAATLALVAPPAPAARDPLTPVIASMVPQRQVVAVRGSDGRFHVLYELMLTNSVGSPATLGPVRIVDAASRRTVRRLSVKEMIGTGALHQLDRRDVKTAKLPVGASRLLTLDVSFRSRQAIPRRLTHRFQVAARDPLTSRPRHFAYDAARVALSRRRPPVYAPPLEGNGWIASDGCCAPSGHVNAMLGLNGKMQASERFAIDWLRIDAAGRMYQGDPSDPANWFSYGAPIKAMGPGVVTVARDGQPDQTPGRMPSDLEFAQLPGNLVVVRGQGGLSQVYAHLAPGSVSVKAGDRVQAGTVLGRLGNTGASLAPHLHVHVVNGPNAATSDGFPYTLTAFSLAGQANVNQLLAAIQGEASFPTADQLHPVARRAELPLGFAIVDF
ncbi:MAG: M23 family metallopeptidase [Solirubrobacterales bacterium]